MRILASAFVCFGLASTVAAQWSLSEIRRSSETEMYTGVYAAGAGGGYSVFATGSSGASSLLRVTDGTLTLETDGTVRELWMNDGNDVAWNYSRTQFSTTTSRLNVFAGGSATAIATTTLNPGAFGSYYMGLSLNNAGGLSYYTVGRQLVYRPDANAGFTSFNGNWPSSTTAFGQNGQTYLTRSVNSQLRLSRMGEGTS